MFIELGQKPRGTVKIWAQFRDACLHMLLYIRQTIAWCQLL